MSLCKWFVPLLEFYKKSLEHDNHREFSRYSLDCMIPLCSCKPHQTVATFWMSITSSPQRMHANRHNPSAPRFASDVQPSSLFIELEDAAASVAAAVGTTSSGLSGGSDERARSATVDGFWLGLDTRHVEDAPGLAVIKRHPGGLEPSKRRPLRAQLQVNTGKSWTAQSREGGDMRYPTITSFLYIECCVLCVSNVIFILLKTWLFALEARREFLVNLQLRLRLNGHRLGRTTSHLHYVKSVAALFLTLTVW